MLNLADALHTHAGMVSHHAVQKECVRTLWSVLTTMACLVSQVYLQAAQGDDLSWNAKFSSMMVKVLQDAYVSSPLHKENLGRSDVLAKEAAPRCGPPKVTLPLPPQSYLFVIDMPRRALSKSNWARAMLSSICHMLAVILTRMTPAAQGLVNLSYHLFCWIVWLCFLSMTLSTADCIAGTPQVPHQNTCHHQSCLQSSH